MFMRQGHALFLREDGIEHVLEPKEFQLGDQYRTQGWLFVCPADQPEVDGLPNLVDLPAGELITFEGMVGEAYQFRSSAGSAYILYRGDVNFITAA